MARPLVNLTNRSLTLGRRCCVSLEWTTHRRRGRRRRRRSSTGGKRMMKVGLRQSGSISRMELTLRLSTWLFDLLPLGLSFRDLLSAVTRRCRC
jgi:hypothetical protein